MRRHPDVTVTWLASGPASVKSKAIQKSMLVFAEEGYVGARMADIARQAGVAVQTLYFAFHTKPELLQACYDRAVLGPQELPPEQPFFAETMAARTGRAALAAFARGNIEIVARVAAIDEVTRAAQQEPEAVAALARNETLRRDGYRTIVHHLAERFGLDPI